MDELSSEDRESPSLLSQKAMESRRMEEERLAVKMTENQQRAVVVILLICVLSIIGNLSISFYNLSTSVSLSSRVHRLEIKGKKICLPCDNSNIWRSKDVEGECCLAAEQLFTVLKDISKVEAKDAVRVLATRPRANSSGSAPTPRTSAHVYVGNTNLIYVSKKKSYTKRRIVDWDLNTFGSHVSGGFRFDNGKVIIPRDGVYLVYSQVTLFSSTTVVTFKHAVEVDNINLPRNEVKDLLSSWNLITPRWEQHSYVSGALELKSGDELTVSISMNQTIELRSDRYLTFLGIVLL